MKLVERLWFRWHIWIFIYLLYMLTSLLNAGFYSSSYVRAPRLLRPSDTEHKKVTQFTRRMAWCSMFNSKKIWNICRDSIFLFIIVLIISFEWRTFLYMWIEWIVRVKSQFTILNCSVVYIHSSLIDLASCPPPSHSFAHYSYSSTAWNTLDNIQKVN